MKESSFKEEDMEALLIGSYWFINGTFFVLLARKMIEARKGSVGWFLGLCFTILAGVLLLLGATICLDHFFEALSLRRGFLFLCFVDTIIWTSAGI